MTQGYYGSVTLESDGTVTYSPGENWFGTDYFTYTASDGTDMDTAMVTVTVNPVNDQPVADAVNVSTDEDTPLAVALSGSDVEGPSVTFLIDALPSHGTLGELSENTVAYYPDGNFSGADSFTFQTYDGQRLSEPATVSITVSEVADSAGVTITATGGANLVSEPGWLVGQEAQSDTYTVVLNTAPTADVTITLAADAQLEVTPSVLTFTPSDWSVAQAVTIDAVADQIAEGEHTAVIAHTAASADPAYNGVSVPNVNVTVTEHDFAGIVMFPPDSPVDLNEEGPTSADYTVELTSKPTANVTVTLAPGSQVTLSASTLVFTPDDWDTAQTVTLTAVNDELTEGYHVAVVGLSAVSADPVYNGLTSDQSVAIIDNDGPSALPDEPTTDEDTAVTFDVRLNDVDLAAQGLTVIEVTQGSHGSVTIEQDGTLTYTPNENWYGEDTFEYLIQDGLARFDTGTVIVTVGAVNDAPNVTNPGSQTFAEDHWVSLQIVAADVEETAFLYTVPEPMPGGNSLPPGLVLDAMTGRIWGRLDPRASGAYTTDVIVDDLNGGVTTVTFDWTIADTNHPPFIDHYGIRHSYVGESDVIGEALDIDGDDPQITEATGLPPGIVWDPERNLIYGTLTTAGTYQVTFSVDDGHGGTDTESFTWKVYRNDQPPPPLALAGWSVGAPSGIDFTLTHPATSLLGTVTLQNPGDPEEPLEVTLSVEPAGRGTISPTSVMLRDGDSATFEITPMAISQEVHDAYVSVRVSGGETCRAYFTNVGMVLPRHVRGPDTPEGMKDRISIGTGNWGSYNAVIGVYPNLLGLYNTEVDFVRPEPDDKYGNAAADADDAQRLAMATQGVVKLFGTVQTAPTEDGQAGNAGKLRLRATVADPNGAGNVQLAMANATSVAAIPIAIKATTAEEFSGTDKYTDFKYWWGVKYNLVSLPDNGSLQFVRYHEITHVSMVQPGGIFRKRLLHVQARWQQELPDWVGFGLSLESPLDLPEARAEVKWLIETLGGQMNVQQYFRFYDAAVDPEPTTPERGRLIPKSGFIHYKRTYQQPARLGIEKAAAAGLGAQPGILAPEAARERIIDPVRAA